MITRRSAGIYFSKFVGNIKLAISIQLKTLESKQGLPNIPIRSCQVNILTNLINLAKEIQQDPEYIENRDGEDE